MADTAPNQLMRAPGAVTMPQVTTRPPTDYEPTAIAKDAEGDSRKGAQNEAAAVRTTDVSQTVADAISHADAVAVTAAATANADHLAADSVQTAAVVAERPSPPVAAPKASQARPPNVADTSAMADAAKKDDAAAVAAAEPAAAAAAAVTAPADDAKPADVTDAEATRTDDKTDDKAGAAASTKAAENKEDAPETSADSADGETKTNGVDATDAADAADAADADAADATDAADAADAAEDDSNAAVASSTPTKPAKTHASLARRKSVGPKLNRKGSKARLVQLDAKPGDHFFVKLKGYPAWPAVICDEDMLPETLTKSRPVTAARADGTYREDYADGGRRATDRTFPVMYLFTNEFGWVPTKDLHELDPEKVLDAINDKMRKDLQQAHQLAADHHPLSYYKDLLRQFQEEQEEAAERKRLAAEAKRQAEAEKRQAAEARRQAAAATPKKAAKKGGAAAAKDGDVDMLDVPEDDDEHLGGSSSTAKKGKKRKADDDARTPQRSDSVKKPKIKITSSGTPKSNGTLSSKGAKSSDGKAGKASKAKEVAPPEPELSPEEKLRRKTKEVLFLRHKIQKGLLPREDTPKSDDMPGVANYMTKLEAFPDLDVHVIRETKINKLLKAILKIATIPRETEFNFKTRSQTMLNKWNKMLAAEPAHELETAVSANGTTNGEAKDASKDEAKSNGVAATAADGADNVKKDAALEDAPAAEAAKPKEEPAAVEAAA